MAHRAGADRRGVHDPAGLYAELPRVARAPSLLRNGLGVLSSGRFGDRHPNFRRSEGAGRFHLRGGRPAGSRPRGGRGDINRHKLGTASHPRRRAHRLSGRGAVLFHHAFHRERRRRRGHEFSGDLAVSEDRRASARHHVAGESVPDDGDDDGGYVHAPLHRPGRRIGGRRAGGPSRCSCWRLRLEEFTEGTSPIASGGAP